MKKFILAIALLIGIASLNNKVEAQSINISINIGSQPSWGPVGYDYVDYYYLPDINCYYNVNAGLFYYLDRGRWFSARYLPYAYSHYDLYGMYKVVLVNIANPWMYNSTHYRDYERYRGYRNQYVIRDSRDDRYRVSRSNNIAWYSGDRNNNYRVRSSQNNYNNYNDGNNNRSNLRNDGRNSNNNSYTDRNKNDNRKDQNYNNSNSNRSRQSENGSNLNNGRTSTRNDNSKRDANVGRSSSSDRSNYRLTSSSTRENRR
ncbi:MAG: hypothetical protein LBN74_08455 [Prevotella sp.]|nr:hypothetical protein [Prevotella sp.]